MNVTCQEDGVNITEILKHDLNLNNTDVLLSSHHSVILHMVSFIRDFGKQLKILINNA